MLQFFLIVAGFAPLVFLGLKDVGGWAACKSAGSRDGTTLPPALGRTPGRTWATPPTNPMGVEWFGMADGARLRAFVRLLVHRFPGGAARHGRRFDVRRAAHASDRGLPEDVVSGSGDSARHDCDCAHAVITGRAGIRAYAAARRDGKRLDYDLTIPHDAAALFSDRYARARSDRVDGVASCPAWPAT